MPQLIAMSAGQHLQSRSSSLAHVDVRRRRAGLAAGCHCVRQHCCAPSMQRQQNELARRERAVQGAWQALREQAAALARERRAFRRCISLVRRGAALAAAEPSGVLVLAVLWG